MNFSNYYFCEANPFSVASKVTWNMFTNLFRDTKKIPVVSNWLWELHKIDKRTYQKLVRKFADIMTYNRKLGKSKITIDDIYRGYLTNLRDQKAKEKLGDYNLKGTPKPNIPVYKFSNGATVTFFDLPNDDEDRIYAIGFDRKASQAIEKLLGMTFKDFLNTTVIDKKQTKKDDETVTVVPNDSEDDFVSVIPQQDTMKQKNLGMMDIGYSDYMNMIQYLGDGKTGGLTQGLTYPFKGQFNREDFSNNIGSGYKYYDGDKSFYLLDIDNDSNDYGLLIFGDKRSYNWARRIGVLNFWKTEPTSKVYWKIGNIDKLPESKEYE